VARIVSEVLGYCGRVQEDDIPCAPVRCARKGAGFCRRRHGRRGDAPHRPDGSRASQRVRVQEWAFTGSNRRWTSEDLDNVPTVGA